MEKLSIKAVNREIPGKTSQALRQAGLVPVELYGSKVGNKHLAVNAIEFEKMFRKAGESTIIEVQMEDGTSQAVLIQDVQYHFLKNKPEHIDFLAVSMTEKLTANVAIEFTGEAPAVKALGGTLVKVLDAVEVECLPADLPHNFEVDISALATFADVITVGDIPVSDKVQILAGAEELVVKVQPPRDVEAELAAEADFDVTKVEGVVKPEAPAEGEAAKEETKE